MIVELWRTQIGARRTFAIAIGAFATALAVVMLASVSVGPAYEAVPPLAVGTLAVAARTYHESRSLGRRRALRAALVTGAVLALYFVGFIVAASLLGQAMHPDGQLRPAWLETGTAVFVLAAVASLLWERDDRRRRWQAVDWVALGLLVVGLYTLVTGHGPWTLIGFATAAGGLLGIRATARHLQAELVASTRAGRSAG